MSKLEKGIIKFAQKKKNKKIKKNKKCHRRNVSSLPVVEEKESEKNLTC